MTTKNVLIIVIAVTVVFCLCLTAVLLTTGVIAWQTLRTTSVVNPPAGERVPKADEEGAVIDPDVTPVPASAGAEETLARLKAVNAPGNDPLELSVRLRGLQPIPPTVAPSGPRQEGDRQVFWVTNSDSNETFQVTAVLRKVVDHAYFWIEEGVRYSNSDLNRLADTFNDKIYPVDREFFGSEWTPGIDGDPHLYILYAHNLGGDTAAYFSSVDSINPLAHRYSNAHEMFMVNADNVTLGEEYAYSVLAHELQHMIHWNNDRNEDTWLNEGFSELAAFLNGYNLGGFDYLFSLNPDQQLNDWPLDANARSDRYGSSFLFVAYFLDRFGEQTTQSLAARPENGLESVDQVLQGLQTAETVNGPVMTADDLFADWTAANYLNDPEFENGRYAYQRYSEVPKFRPTETISQCDGSWLNRSVNQYGTDYIQVDCAGKVELTFQGANEVKVLAAEAASGQYAFWSNLGDESDMSLTQTFDLRQTGAPIDFNFKVWYDLEQDYDYVYLSASTDGVSWTMLNPQSCTFDNPTGNNYGCGFNGASGGYRRESVDLSAYAGQQVTLRFDYITDAAVTGQGLLVDDAAIPQIGYSSDFEQDDGGWTAEGFVRIVNRLPQTFRITVIEQGNQPMVETVTLDAANRVTMLLDNPRGNETTIVVSGTSRFTRETANYAFSLNQIPSD